jgi:outer membrane protein TolC
MTFTSMQTRTGKMTDTIINDNSGSHRLSPLTAFLFTAALSGCAVTPHPISQAERSAEITRDKAAMFGGQDAISAPITLEDAIARALKYNLDNRLKLMEEALSQRQLDGANFNLLPKLTANAGYSSRNNEYGSSSQDLATGNQSLVPSTSQDKEHTVSDLTFSWNVLDFGVSYFQAKQQADQSLVLHERRRKVVQTMVQQVRQAYWLVVGSQLLETKIDQAMQDAEQALRNSRTAEQERLRAPLESLTYQRQMLDVLRQLEVIRDELAQAKPRLASLMNLPPSEPYRVVVPTDLEVPVVNAELSKMEELALLNRPELMEASYNERISVLETRKAIARLFPGVEFSAGANYDTNSFLVNNSWNATGIQVGWNLLNVFNIGNTKRTAAAQLEVSRNQRLALNMAVLTQVHVAYRDYLGRRHQYERSSDMFGVDQRILTHTRNAASTSAESRLQEVRASSSAVMSELRLYQNYGALQSAYGQILATLGVDLLPQTLPSHDLAVLSAAVKQAEQDADHAFGTTSAAADPVTTTVAQ